MPVATPDLREQEAARTALAPLYNVVLLDDDDHTYEYVIRMLAAVFGFDADKGMAHARDVDQNGRTVLLTTTLEHAELKQQQVHAFGPDPLLARSQGPMHAILEPA
ncbi:MAG: ATP-dependent Clp protease adaptor ClpS [Nitrospirota bacterium]|nr:ATP-dependent Clp protease adaptor ClpS [Nitrospirota bacterium]